MRITPALLLVGAIAILGAAALSGRRALGVVEVEGGSMVPTFHPGDRLLVESLTFRSRAPRVGEIVVAADPRQPSRELVKRIGAVDPGSQSAELAGDAAGASTDSRSFGPVPLADIRWRVVARYWPPRNAPSPQNEAMPSTQAVSSAGSM